MAERVLVTGGAGFIGSHVVERLVQLGYSVRVLDDLSSGCLSNLSFVADSVEFVRGDVRMSMLLLMVLARLCTLLVWLVWLSLLRNLCSTTRLMQVVR